MGDTLEYWNKSVTYIDADDGINVPSFCLCVLCVCVCVCVICVCVVCVVCVGKERGKGVVG